MRKRVTIEVDDFPNKREKVEIRRFARDWHSWEFTGEVVKVEDAPPCGDVTPEEEKVTKPIYPNIIKFEYGERIPIEEGKIIVVSEEHYVTCEKGAIKVYRYPKEPPQPAPDNKLPYDELLRAAREKHKEDIRRLDMEYMAELRRRAVQVEPAPLKPCPFCGGEAEIDRDSFDNVRKVECERCGASTMDVPEWNRRVTG